MVNALLKILVTKGQVRNTSGDLPRFNFVFLNKSNKGSQSNQQTMETILFN